jgi:hypothetical protein
MTGARDSHNHLWISRVDAGKYTPTHVIELIDEHQIQFKSKVFIEEVGYQVALGHFARQAMEKPGANIYTPNQLPSDNRKGAKELRINSLEPIVRNGMFHILSSMTQLATEMEDYPYSSTKDILDVAGSIARYAKSSTQSIEAEKISPFSLDSILKEIEDGNGGGNDIIQKLRKEQHATTEY